MKRTIMRRFKLNEISAVDRPAQTHARAAIMKSATPPNVAVQVAVGSVDAMSFVKRSAADAFVEYKRQVETAARTELRKLEAGDVGVASTKPKNTDLVDVNERTYDATVKTAYQRLREIAEQVRAASGKLTIEQAMERVYSDARYKNLVARERAERYAGARYVEAPDMD